MPKLFVKGQPGLILTELEPHVGLVRSWPNLTEVAVPGLHYLQEDSPDNIGIAVAQWLAHIE